MLVQTRDIDISFFGVQVLFDVDFELKAGEIHCLCGENGAGKSTLVKILTGIYTHYTGDIFVQGQPVQITNTRMARELGLFAVQQHRDLVPTLNAVENVFIGNEIIASGKRNRLDFCEMKKRTEELISSFKMDIDLEVPVRALRLSEQGIIAICKALATDTQILLIDEASAPLDNTEREVLYDILRKLKNEGKGIVYISHHLDEIFNIGERVTVLRNGRRVCTVPVAEIDHNELINAMTGDIKVYERTTSPQLSSRQDGNLLEFRNVSSDNLRDISFDVRNGEIIGFAGLEGSHKDEIAKIIFGLTPTTGGEILYKGQIFSSGYPIQSIKKGIGLVPNDRKNQGLVTCRSVSENIILSAINKFGRFIVNALWQRRASIRNIKRLMIRTSGPTQIIEYLSGGNQQKVLISKWLETGLELLFLIEPTEGIDVGARADLYTIFRELAGQGTALVFFTSDIDELLVLSDRIFTLVEGRIVQQYEAIKAEKKQILADILLKEQTRSNDADRK
ncbi:MAG: sugar ABC transporter ATP-binding protein [Spirochaetaceae bacterium]|nr:MAG: sugar ABC transporter ATP-binding protein [Spirochaetaceae bacterium]